MRMWVQSLASISGLRILCRCELWHRLQTQLGSGVAVAVMQASTWSSDSTPSLTTSMCCGCGPKHTHTHTHTHTHLQRCRGRKLLTNPSLVPKPQTPWAFPPKSVILQDYSKAQGRHFLGLLINLTKSEENNGKNTIWSRESNAQKGKATNGPHLHCLHTVL